MRLRWWSILGLLVAGLALKAIQGGKKALQTGTDHSDPHVALPL